MRLIACSFRVWASFFYSPRFASGLKKTLFVPLQLVMSTLSCLLCVFVEDLQCCARCFSHLWIYVFAVASHDLRLHFYVLKNKEHMTS